MKKKGSTCCYITLRNRELAEKALKLALERGVSLKDVIDEAAESEASRFWIDESRALILVRERLRGRIQKRPLRARMIAEITRRTKAIIESDPDKKLIDAVFETVNSPAPSFYISPRSVKRAILSRMNGFIPEYRPETSQSING